MAEKIETVIIGGGQAGLAVSYYLGQAGKEHLILEQASQPANAWFERRWDSFTLVTPNWSFMLPGMEYRGEEPDGFIALPEIQAAFERYIQENNQPIRCNTRVTSVDPLEGCYTIATSAGKFEARNVVVATGALQSPRFPPVSKNFPVGIRQVHSSQYRNPQSLPPGGVLVVGSGQSGCQIAEELYWSGRKVYLSVSGVGRAPRRYRGRDIFAWLTNMGFFDRTLDMLRNPREAFAPSPQLTGRRGGYSLNLHCFARDGIQLVGRIRNVQQNRVYFAPDLHANLSKADQFERQLTQQIDQYIQRAGLDNPEEELPSYTDGFMMDDTSSIDVFQDGISTVIWATGYRTDFSYVHMPLFNEFGLPTPEKKAGKHPHVHFVGFPFVPKMKSAFLMGIKECARQVVEQL